MNVDNEVVGKIMELNKIIMNKVEKLDNLGEEIYSNVKVSNAIIFRHMRKLLEKEIVIVTRGKGIVGVDGSINTVGSSFPHYISIMKALAKCTDSDNQDIVLAQVHTPIFEEEQYLFLDENISPADRDEKIKAAKMAKLELQAAYEAIEKMDISLIMMDGSLIRYKINCAELWEEFVTLALKKSVYVIGVIEEIKTRDLCKILNGNDDSQLDYYDREILFGKLKIGEMITIKDSKQGRGLIKSFMRTSNDPHVIGLDILEEQKEKLNDLSDLVYTLTNEGGRGIPLWLDIVDKEVKITNKYVEAFVETYIDPSIRQRFFTAKRDNRSL